MQHFVKLFFASALMSISLVSMAEHTPAHLQETSAQIEKLIPLVIIAAGAMLLFNSNSNSQNIPEQKNYRNGNEITISPHIIIINDHAACGDYISTCKKTINSAAIVIGANIRF